MLTLLVILMLFLCFLSQINRNSCSNYSFPQNFLFGTATSAYQSEGAWNADGVLAINSNIIVSNFFNPFAGKGEGIWDKLVHYRSELVQGGSNGNVACNSYNKYLEDVAILKDLGVDFYRFSLSWTRILPDGLTNNINPEGISYYNKIIDALLANNIQPMITLFHWNLPQHLQDIGGWLNPNIVKYFTEYAKIAFENFGDRVKTWFTINEPKLICNDGYGDMSNAPALNLSGIGEYICTYNILKSHASAYRLYNETFKPLQNGRISIIIDILYPIAATNSTADTEAQKRQIEFLVGIYTHPIFHPEGNYPKMVIERVANRSRKEGFTKSRLTPLSEDDVAYIKGTYDFFGLNHYSAYIVKDTNEPPISDPSGISDRNVEVLYNPLWTGSSVYWLKVVVPEASRETLLWIRDNCNNPEILVMENGYCDDGRLNDENRIQYLKLYLKTLLNCIYSDKINVTAYAVWSFLDVFEWLSGYRIKFGLYHVDFNDPNRTRTPKLSAQFYKNLLQTRYLEM